MYTLNQTDKFKDWLDGLTHKKVRARILARLRSAAAGNFGDHKPVGDGVYEMRIDTGPGYRAYYTRMDKVIYLMLLGGDKSTQRSDIQAAIAMAKELKA